MSRKTIVALLVGLVTLVVGVPIAIVLLRVFVFIPFRTPSASMYPSFVPGSHVFANQLDKKAAYGAVLVFHFPEDPSQEFQKRVMGLPGDKIEMHAGVLSINGWEVPHCTVGKHSYDEPDTATTHTGTLEVEWLGDATYLVFHDDHPAASEFGPYIVSEGQYFAMGDNRDNSYDSRNWHGGAPRGVPNENTVGRVRAAEIALPRGAESLQTALDACLLKRPSKTRP